jgi:hypothetical protein
MTLPLIESSIMNLKWLPLLTMDKMNLESTTQFYKSDIDKFMLHIQKIK